MTAQKKVGINAGMLVITVFLSLLLPAGAVSTETEWTHLFTRDGIEVYRKIVPGTRVCAFKGVGIVDAEMAVVGSVVQDISDYPKWVDRCKESVVLKEIDQDTKIIYGVIDTPPPFKDRDMVLSNKTVCNPEKGLVEISFDVFKQGLIPPQDKYFRISELSGKYRIESISPNKTRVTFVYQGNPGGNIPVAIANWVASRRYPHTIIMGLRQMVKEQNCITLIQSDDFNNQN